MLFLHLNENAIFNLHPTSYVEKQFLSSLMMKFKFVVKNTNNLLLTYLQLNFSTRCFRGIRAELHSESNSKHQAEDAEHMNERMHTHNLLSTA